jgi:predicted NAD/FAD-dependent oxidoreductase
MQSDKLVKSEQKMQSQIAKALRTDLNTSVQISMKAVSYNSNCWHLLTLSPTTSG